MGHARLRLCCRLVQLGRLRCWSRQLGLGHWRCRGRLGGPQLLVRLAQQLVDEVLGLGLGPRLDVLWHLLLLRRGAPPALALAPVGLPAGFLLIAVVVHRGDHRQAAVLRQQPAVFVVEALVGRHAGVQALVVGQSELLRRLPLALRHLLLDLLHQPPDIMELRQLAAGLTLQGPQLVKQAVLDSGHLAALLLNRLDLLLDLLLLRAVLLEDLPLRVLLQPDHLQLRLEMLDRAVQLRLLSLGGWH
mmetsp:Transcript_17293/g.41314  ORF Transcript_17293/g.41314 Transcript_17293/m.41314 type:complete len:246 (-) Transcript_17293:748-1485(-)